jgi:DNA-binding response OmpR family regulator
LIAAEKCFPQAKYRKKLHSMSIISNTFTDFAGFHERTPQLQAARILVIDDAEADRRRLASVLGEVPYRVTLAADGEQGYHLATVDQPDLIVLEVGLPRMDGHACCRLLKAHPATGAIPVIFLSAQSRPEDRIRGLSLGAVDFVSKPFDTGELVARIRVHLNLVPRAPAAAVAPADSGNVDLDTVIVQAARQMIATNLASLPGLAEIARAVGTHRDRLSELFQAHTGSTVFEFIRNERFTRGVQLLRDTDMDVGDIARLVGFTNAGNFATAFRDRMGLTPSAFRRSATATREAGGAVAPAPAPVAGPGQRRDP